MITLEQIFQAMEESVNKTNEPLNQAAWEYNAVWEEMFGQMAGNHFNEVKSLLRRPLLVFLKAMRLDLLKSLPVDPDFDLQLEKQKLLTAALTRRLVARELGEVGEDYGRKKSSSTKTK